MGELNGKVVLVIGGGRGIGRSLALGFAEQGARVVVAARSKEEIEYTAIKIRSMGVEGFAVQVSVSNPKSVEQMVRMVIEKFNSIDILINAAAIQGPIGPTWENNINLWIETLNVNLIGTFLSIQKVIPFMINQGGGKIINISGGGAANSRPNFSAYAVSKTGILRLTEILAEELKPYNIQVFALAPGAAYTKMTEEIINAGDKAGINALDEAKLVISSGGTPGFKPANLAVFLASHDNSPLNGRLVHVNESYEDLIKQKLSPDAGFLRRISY